MSEPEITLEPVLGIDSVRALWARLVRDTPHIERAFGPEWIEARPRLGEHYFVALTDGLLGDPAECGPTAIGMAFARYPAPTTATFGLGLFFAWRSRGWGPALRDGILKTLFARPETCKVETEIYSSNAPSLVGLHAKHGRMREEGRQLATIVLEGVPYDRLLLGISRAEWDARR